MNKIQLFPIVFILGCCAVSVAQHSKSSYQSANGLIIERSMNATSVAKREFIEKQSNDAIAALAYNNAIGEWQEVLKKDPENSNLNYKLGLCYFFSFDQQLKALPYFKKAIKNLTNTYDFSNEKEVKAPYSSYYFLAETYRENNQADSAIKYFSLYEDDFESVPISTELGLFMSLNSKESIKNPRNVKVSNFGNVVNTNYAETNPVMRLDNKYLFFSSRRPNGKENDSTGTILFDADIYYTFKTSNDLWTNAIPFAFNTEYDEAPLYLNPNGDILYFRRTIKNNTDIYKTEWSKNVWSKPVPVHEINTPFNETGLSMTGDGKYLYFCSDQNKEAGKYDIFKYTKQANGKWGELELLSSIINTPYNQISPNISPDGKTLFYSTNGSSKKGVGGYDIYYSELKSDNTWSESSSMGYPINKSRDDINYGVASDDKRYYSSLTENASYDIFLIEGGGFDFESIAASTEVITVTNEMGVTQVMETEKSVEKEVEVAQAVETIVEKEVEVVKAVEEEKEKEVPLATDTDANKSKNDPDLKENTTKTEPAKKHLNPDDLNLDNLDEASKALMIDNVKRYLTSELKTNESVIYKIIYFDVNKKSLSHLSKTELKLLIDFMNEQKSTKIELVGHTDNTGPWTYNNELSIKRANEVYNFLLSNNISPQRLHYYGKGSTTPFATNDTEEGKTKNRRVEIVLIK